MVPASSLSDKIYGARAGYYYITIIMHACMYHSCDGFYVLSIWPFASYICSSVPPKTLVSLSFSSLAAAPCLLPCYPSLPLVWLGSQAPILLQWFMKATLLLRAVAIRFFMPPRPDFLVARRTPASGHAEGEGEQHLFFLPFFFRLCFARFSKHQRLGHNCTS